MSKKTHYLADSNTKEIHDLSNPVMDCKLEKINKEYITFLQNNQELNEYLDEGYDGCPFCLRTRSQKAKKSS
ncbi:hypothetical protein [Selenihalanaerobacter shriftii]|uniref:Uncharacterized protein n=1 Tax=Selenihalanaerobacter shriftii TaxID=142842 RepID=A0A1T4LD06_9FIRM|nr:hypothetical protein [Selenihalanaerobacter shriftii]SJZ52533.1 hypothetical protein SAMN02745118_01085 [Selenihalanaerobacter shriftii]